MTYPYRLHYLASSFVPNTDASSVHVVRMAAALGAQTHGTTLFCKAGAAALTGDQSIEAYYGLPQPLDMAAVPFRGRLDLLRYLHRQAGVPRPDLALGRYAYASLWAAARGVPTVYEVHAPATGAKRLTEQQLFKRPAFLGLVSITEALAGHYRERYPELADRLIVLPDAANDPGSSPPVRSGGALQVAYAGGFFPGRGLELIVELARALPGVEFHLAGGDTAELAALGLEAPANLHCRGYLAPAAVDNFLRRADVLLAPYGTRVMANHGRALETTRWCSPMKLFEYLSHGKAILCSDLPVLREVLHDEGNALLLPPEDTAAWLRAIERLDQDRGFARQLGATARADFLIRHSWSQRAQRLLAFATERLAQGTRPR